MYNYTVRVLLLIFAMTLYACATMVDGTSQVVTFNSNPSGAEVIMDGVSLGVTPLSKEFKRDKNKVVLIKMEGYEEQLLSLQTTVNLWLFGNLLTPFATGSTTDMSNGAAIEFRPNTYYIPLAPKRVSQAERSLLKKKMRARNFILLEYSNLIADLARGKGEYLSSVYEILGIDEAHEKEGLQQLRELLSRHQEILSFTEAVLASTHRL